MAQSINFFDDQDQLESSATNEGPIWRLDLSDKSPANAKRIHRWLLNEMNFLKEENRERFQQVFKTLAMFKGVQYNIQDTREDRPGRDQKTAVQKIVANHVYDLVQNAVSRLVKYKPAVAVLPDNPEELEDRVAAEVTKGWLDSLWYKMRYDGVIDPQVKRAAKVMGECFVKVEWDEDLGDLHPEFVEKYQYLLKKESKVELLDENGSPVLNASGEPVLITKEQRVGDVCYKVVKTTDVLMQRKDEYSKVDYLFERDVLATDEARMKWPDSIDPIITNRQNLTYDYEKMEIRKCNQNEVVVWCFTHRRTPYCSTGARIYFTLDGIIEIEEFPFEFQNQLNYIRLVDKLPTGEVHGVSAINWIKGLVGLYNNLKNMVARNQMLVSHPKWVMPAQSANIESLGNDITVVQYKGAIAPQLVQMSPTPPEVFTFMNSTKEEFQQIYGIFGVSRGEPPPGIKAGVALQFLSEQEQERANEDILFANEFQIQLAKLTIQVAAEKYDDSDQRKVKFKSASERWRSVVLNTKHLVKNQDVVIQNSSALPNSKAARIQTLTDLKSQFPTLVSDEQFLDTLDMAQDKKFITLATRSVRAAEAENEMLLDPLYQGPLVEPMEYEDLILHWKVHSGAMRDWSFKNATSEELQQNLMDHVLATELLIEQKANENRVFFEKVATELGPVGFPLLYKTQMLSGVSEVMPPMSGQMQSPTQGQFKETPETVAMPGGMPGDVVAETLPPLQ